MGSWKPVNQIQDEVGALRKLKENIPQQNALGEDNRRAVEAQIEVLDQCLNAETILAKWGDERRDDFAQNVLDEALYACDWLSGELAEEEVSPAAAWAPLASSKDRRSSKSD